MTINNPTLQYAEQYLPYTDMKRQIRETTRGGWLNKGLSGLKR